MPIPGRKITVQLDPDDPDATVELSLVEDFTTEEGAGKYFQRRKLKINNSDDFSRTIAIREITHKQRLPDDDPDDEEQKLKAEVIIEMTTEEGSGASFRRRIYGMEPVDFLKFRKGQIERVHNKDDPDVWLDLQRWDQRVTFEGSGPTYQARLLSAAWPRGEGNEFDNNALTAEAVPSDPKTPVRTDYLQDVVNLNVGVSDILVIQAAQNYNTVDSFDLGATLFSATTTKKNLDGSLIFPPIVDLDITQTLKRTTDKPTDSPPKPPLAIVDPMSGEMRGRGILWTRSAAHGTGNVSTSASEDRYSTLFVNLKKFFSTKSSAAGAHGDVFVNFPAFNEAAYAYELRWAFPGQGINLPVIFGRDSDVAPFLDLLISLGAVDTGVFNVTTGITDDYPGVSVGSSHHLPAGFPLPGGGVTQANLYVPASVDVIAYSFRKKTKFPLDEHGRVILTAPTVPPLPPSDTQAEFSAELGNSAFYLNPLAPTTIRVRVKFPDLSLELQVS